MRERDPFLIVKEYTQATEPPQVRKNSVTALAILVDDARSRALLAELALTDSDNDVRDQVEAEIAALPSEPARLVLEPVLDDLKHPEKRRAAYALLGQLRNRGVSFLFPPLSLVNRLRLAISMRDRVYPRRGFGFHVRTLKGVALGLVLAWLMTMIFCVGLVGLHFELWSTIGYALVALLISSFLASASTYFSSPARLYADAGGGAMLDMAMAGLVAFCSVAIILLLSLLAPNDQSSAPKLIALVIIPLTTAVVRAGTLSVFGITRSGRLNRLLQTVVGGSCGLGFLNLALMLTDTTDNLFLARTWMLVVLIAYGLAGGFAAIDSKSSLMPVAPAYARWLGLSLPVLLVASILFSLKGLPRATDIEAGAMAFGKKSFPIHQVPVTIRFQIPPSSLTVYRGSLHLADLWTDDGNKITPSYPPRASSPDLYQVVGPGNYELTVRLSDTTVNVFEAVPELAKSLSWPLVRARLMGQLVAGGPVLATIQLEVKPLRKGSTQQQSPYAAPGFKR